MQKINKNVVLLELGGSHSECMHLQIKALKDNGYNVFLICNTNLINDFPDTDIFTDYQLHNINSSFISHLKSIKKIRQFLKKHNINTIIINTVEITIIRNMLALLPLPKIKNYVGILHNGRKIDGKRRLFKWTRRRIKKIFVLSQSILQNLNIEKNRFKINYFYPIYFPDYSDLNMNKPEGETWITILGHMSPNRREINYLFQSMENENLDKSVRLILLGSFSENDYPKYKELLAKSDNIVKFNSRVANNIVDTYLKHTDIMMPLFNPDVMGEFRISGSYNSAYAYKIPLYLDNGFKNNVDFKGVTLFFDKSENLVSQINQLVKKKVEINKCKDALLNHPIYTVEKQCEHFINFIFNE